MKVARLNRLNRFLLVLIFLGIVSILLKEKEGFGNAITSSLDEVYDGAILKHFVTNPTPHKDFAKTLKEKRGKIEKRNLLKSFKETTNNVRYLSIPCDDSKYDGGICKALYKNNEIIMKHGENCMPGFMCRRVGFFCSKISEMLDL